MMLKYAKLNAGGNTTVFIGDSVLKSRMPQIAKTLMEPDILNCDQVGFCIDCQEGQDYPYLHMMGGEFCGNATRSLAAWIAMGGLALWDGGKQPDLREGVVTVTVSGHNAPIPVTISRGGLPNSCHTQMDMPLPIKTIHGINETLGYYSIVAFEGIEHVILWECEAHSRFLAPVRNLLMQNNFKASDVGVMYYNDNKQEMTPLVYIESVDSLVWEGSCGSGSVAVACAIADREQRSIDHLSLCQPKGSIDVQVDFCNNNIIQAQISGDVQLISYGFAAIV